MDKMSGIVTRCCSHSGTRKVPPVCKMRCRELVTEVQSKSASDKLVLTSCFISWFFTLKPLDCEFVFELLKNNAGVVTRKTVTERTVINSVYIFLFILCDLSTLLVEQQLETVVSSKHFSKRNKLFSAGS